MSKIAIIYWSGTGNTQTMAETIARAIQSVDSEVDLFNVSDFKGNIDDYEKIAFGCPSMGTEVLEESEFEPFFSSISSKLKDKKVALFGSYGWGDGEWMRNWEDSAKQVGAIIFNECLIINESPDESGLMSCKEFGTGFAKF